MISSDFSYADVLAGLSGQPSGAEKFGHVGEKHYLRDMKIEEAIVYVLASANHGMRTERIADIINEKGLFQRMQELGYSHGCCTVVLQVVSQSKDVAREMLLYSTDGRPKEKRFIEKLGQVCSKYGITL